MSISYDQWVKHVFDHSLPPPVDPQTKQVHFDTMREQLQQLHEGKVTYEEVKDDIAPQPWQEWYNQLDAPILDPPADDLVEFITRAFNEIASLARLYSDGQINQGIYYILSNGISDYMFVMMDADVDITKRIAGIQSFYTVYETLYAKTCGNALGHLSEEQNPLNRTCYMWWDIMPIFGTPDNLDEAPIFDACLDVMTRTLDLPSDACKEGALHGLGHWHYSYPQRVETIINDFLIKHASSIRAELKQYALSARAGHVL